jgi:hypothetical protein
MDDNEESVPGAMYGDGAATKTAMDTTNRIKKAKTLLFRLVMVPRTPCQAMRHYPHA